MNVAFTKFFLCLEFSQTTCLVLWITEKFETRNTKSLHNKSIQVNHPTMVLATTFPFTFLTLNVVSPTQCLRGSLPETQAGGNNLSREYYVERTVFNSIVMEACNSVAHLIGFRVLSSVSWTKLNYFYCLSLLPDIVA